MTRLKGTYPIASNPLEREIAARAEQHWCPIKHAQRLRSPHSRYGHFFDYGDARDYSKQVETVRNDFVDVKTLTK